VRKRKDTWRRNSSETSPKHGIKACETKSFPSTEHIKHSVQHPLSTALLIQASLSPQPRTAVPPDGSAKAAGARKAEELPECTSCNLANSKLNKLPLTVDIHGIYLLSSAGSTGHAAGVLCRIRDLGPRYLQELPSVNIQRLGTGNHRAAVFVPHNGRNRDSLGFTFQIYKIVEKRRYLCGSIPSFDTRRDYFKRQNNSIKALVYKSVWI